MTTNSDANAPVNMLMSCYENSELNELIGFEKNYFNCGRYRISLFIL